MGVREVGVPSAALPSRDGSTSTANPIRFGAGLRATLDGLARLGWQALSRSQPTRTARRPVEDVLEGPWALPADV
jgi:hypothetical protein